MGLVRVTRSVYCAVRNEFVYISNSQRYKVNLRSVVGRVVLWQDFLWLLPFCPVDIISPVLHNHLHLHALLIGRTNGRNLEIFQKAMLYGKSVALNKVFGQGNLQNRKSFCETPINMLLRNIDKQIRTHNNYTWYETEVLFNCTYV